MISSSPIRPRHSPVNREAWPVLAVLFLAAVAGCFLSGPEAAAWAGGLFLAAGWLARNPRCTVPSSPLAVVSPVSGRLLSAGPGHDPWLARPAAHFRIRTSPWNPHGVRSPVEGRVVERWPARESLPWRRRRHGYRIRTDEGDEVVLGVELGIGAPFVRTGLHSGRRLGQGQPCGFIYFAGTVDVFIPAGSRVEAQAGGGLAAGADVLGYLVHEEPETAVGSQ